MSETRTSWTLPQIAKIAAAEYRTLKSWRDRGLISPGIHDAGGGTGRVDLWSQRDLELICCLARLRARGLDMNALTVVAEDLRAAPTANCPVCSVGVVGLNVPQQEQPPTTTEGVKP